MPVTNKNPQKFKINSRYTIAQDSLWKTLVNFMKPMSIHQYFPSKIPHSVKVKIQTVVVCREAICTYCSYEATKSTHSSQVLYRVLLAIAINGESV